MQTAILILGAALIVVGLAGFVRSLWRSPNKKSSANNYETSLQGMQGNNHDGAGHHWDGGGHSGGDAGGH